MSPSRFFCTTSLSFKQIIHNLKGRKTSSQEWLIRQMKDPYIEMAKMENYRCRSAFKLLEIDNKHNILTPGMCVIDLGSAPGSWTQVAASRVNSHGKDPDKEKGFVVSLDRLPIHAIDGAITLGGWDFTKEESRSKIIDLMNGRTADLVMSDMAPNATGIKHSDHDSILNLAYTVVRFTFETSKKGGSLLIKLWDGGGTPKFVSDLQTFYSSVKRVKPPASRSDSAEIFILAREFRGILKNN